MNPNNKKPLLPLPRPRMSSPSTPPHISQNRITPLSPFPRNQSPSQSPRAPYSALARIPNIYPSQTSYSSVASSSNMPKNPNKPESKVNPNRQIIKILEPEEEEKLNQDYGSLIKYIYPRNSHFYTTDHQTREYYETILIESKSIELVHTPDTNNPAVIGSSKVKILNVLSLEDWGDHPYVNKVLVSFPEYPGYNYYDYQEAWEKAFLLKNHTHTWFFRFNEVFPNKYPRWFVKWFRYMGSIPEIFPQKVLEGYQKYKSVFPQKDIPQFEYTLQFMIIFRLPWIMSWNYKKQEADRASPPLLTREYTTRWWNAVKEDQADIKAVMNYYNSLVNISSPESSSSNKSYSDEETIRRIQNCKSEAEIQRIIDEVRRSPTPSEDIYQDSQDPYEDF